MAFNKVIIMGNITHDLELKQTQSGISVCSFSIAVNRKAKQGEQEATDFFTVQTWRQTAEFVAKYFGKGKPILVCGELQNRTWTDKQGTKRTTTEVVASEVCFCGAKDDGVSNNATNTANASQSENSVPVGYNPYLNNTANFDNVAQDEDLPF